MIEDVERALAGPDGDLEPGARARVPQGDAHGVGRRIPQQAHVQPVVAAVGEFAEIGHGLKESPTRAEFAPSGQHESAGRASRTRIPCWPWTQGSPTSA